MISQHDDRNGGASGQPAHGSTQRWWFGAGILAAATLPALGLIGSKEWGVTQKPPPDPVARVIPKDPRTQYLDHLDQLDADLLRLRTELVWRDHQWAVSDPKLAGTIEQRIRAVRGFLDRAETDHDLRFAKADREKFGEQLGVLEELVRTPRTEMDREDFNNLNAIREFLKGAILRVPTPQQMSAVSADVEPKPAGGADESGPIDVEARRKAYPPRIATVGSELKTDKVIIDAPISDTLWGLYMLSGEDRKRLSRAIIENPLTKVERIEERTEPGFEEPVMHVYVKRTVPIMGDIEREISLHFRQTIEKRNTTLTGAGAGNDGGVIIRNTLVDEVPIDDIMTITAYNTCLSYYGCKEPGYEGKTEITFAADMEVTFFKKNDGSFASTAYRSAGKYKSKASLEEIRGLTLEHTAERLTKLVEEGRASLKGIPVPQSEPEKRLVMEAVALP